MTSPRMKTATLFLSIATLAVTFHGVFVGA